ncbi:MAG: inositol monophosphatase family protein, partial [Acidobacteriota bacterium]
QGTYMNGMKIRLENTDPLLPLSANKELRDRLKSLGQSDSDQSAIGSTLSALAGEAKAYVVNVGFVWDFAVPALLFTEAGWEVTDFQGNEYSWDDRIEFGHPGIVAAPKELHTRIMDALGTLK